MKQKNMDIDVGDIQAVESIMPNRKSSHHAENIKNDLKINIALDAYKRSDL